MISPIAIKKLESSGTSRVEDLEKALRDSNWLGYFTLIYVLLMWFFCIFLWPHDK